MTTAVSFTKVSKYFMRGTPNQVKALDSVDLDIASGQFVTVIGSNGAGKSTMLKSLSGHAFPDEGRIEFEGRDISFLPIHKRAQMIGRIAQDPHESTCAMMSIAENLAMAGRRGQSRGLRIAVTHARKAEYRTLLAPIGLGLEGRLDARVGTLSGGQRQALALVMATLSGSRLLLLDEHLAALDPKTAETVMNLTGSLVAEQGLTTFMVTHNMAEAIRWGDRLLMMHRGRIVFDVTGAAKQALTVPDLIAKFREVSAMDIVEDRALLAQ